MKKIYLISLIISLFLITVFASAETTDTGQAPCTGGACSIDSIRNNSLFNNNQNTIFQNQNFNIPAPANSPVTTDGLDSTPYSYDPNCQFGNCLSKPAGSTER